jgi:hypothetical protein
MTLARAVSVEWWEKSQISLEVKCVRLRELMRAMDRDPHTPSPPPLKRNLGYRRKRNGRGSKRGYRVQRGLYFYCSLGLPGGTWLHWETIKKEH